MSRIALGSKVRDRVTGFKGVATGRTEWLYGCIRYVVQPEGTTKEGKLYEPQTFDEDALEVTKAADEPKMKDTGGPDLPGRTPVRAPSTRR